MKAAIGLLILLAGALRADDRCEASAETLAVLQRNIRPGPDGESRTDRARRQTQEMRAALGGERANYFQLQHLILLQRTLDRAGVAGWIDREYSKHPDTPAYTTSYAESLWGQDTPRAIALLEKQADYPPARMALARIYSYGRFKDDAKARAHAEAYAKACPASLERRGLNLAGEAASQPTLEAMLAAVRRRLESEPYVWNHRHAWEAVWPLSFKGKQPGEFAGIRETIRKDVARLEAGPMGKSPDGVRALAAASRQAGDLAKETELIERLIREFPRSEEGQAAWASRWRRENPYPKPELTGDARRAAFSALAASAEKAIAEKGERFEFTYIRFRALRELNGEGKAAIVEAGIRALAAMREEGGQMAPPLEIEVAEAAMDHSVMIDQAPGLLHAAESMSPRFEEADHNVDEHLERTREGRRELPLETAAAWLRYYRLTGNREEALKRVAAWRAIAVTSLFGRFRRDAVEAGMAEWEGRKLDALILYRRAAARLKEDRRPEVTRARDRAAALLKEVGGGSDALLAELEAGRTGRAETATEGVWQRKSGWKLPAFQLTDLSSGKWTRESFAGKTVIANVWASWCGPCRQEHPEFEKVYRMAKDRKDLLVVSLNIDENQGVVEPYMKEGKYTFPVLLAGDLVESMLPLVSIPRVWLISPGGEIVWEQTGFAPGEPGWAEGVIRRAEEMGR